MIIPLGELCQLLGLAIHVDVTRGTADGFFLAEDRRFLLDIPSQRIVVQGQTKPFDAMGIELHRDDIYVDTRLIGQWLPVDLIVDQYASLLTVRPREPLPVQMQKDREARIQKDLAGLGLGVPRYPGIRNDYKMFDGPFLDATTQLTWNPTPTGHRAGIQSSLLLTGDLLDHEASAYISGSDKGGVTDKRFSMGRKDPDGQLLGPLGAREYAAGSILYPGLDLISLPVSGNGFVLSNFPLDAPTQFDQQTFRGELPSGWQVEIYRNGALLAFQQSRPDGLYQFDNIPLLFGLNLFRLVFYGPFGQRREERYRFNVGESLTPRGQLHYRLVGNDPSATGERGHLELEYGLSSRISVLADAASLDLPDGRHEYGRVGLRGFWDVLFAHAEGLTDRFGGSAVNAGIQTRIGPIGILAERAQLSDGFESEIFRPVFGPIESRTTVRLDATVPTTFLPAFPVSVEYLEDRLTTGLTERQINNRISLSAGGIAVSNFINWTSFRGSSAPSDLAIGDFLVSKLIRDFAVRGEAVYDIRPRTDLSTLALTVESRAIQPYLFQAGINRLVRAGQTQYIASVNRSEGLFGFGLNLGYTDHGGGLTAALTFNISFARNPRGPWRMQARPLASGGAASARVFVDANGNGVFDPGEKPLEGVGFSVTRGATDARTGPDGLAFIPNLPSYQQTGVAIALKTLEDPLAVLSRPGVEFVPRPGKATIVDFPVVISGEITGTVYMKRDGGSEPSGGVQLELVDAASHAVVKSLRSAYDGFYDLTGVAPGRYLLRANPEQMQRLGLKPPEPRPVEVAATGTVVDGFDLILEGRLHP